MERSLKKIKKKKLSTFKYDADATRSDESVLNFIPYDILRLIFQYLNGKDLASVAMVCRSWLEAANNEKLTRGPCIIIKPYNKFYSFKRSLENLRIKSSICFCFLDRRLYYKKGKPYQQVARARITPTLQTGGYETMYYDCTFIVADKEMSRHPISNIACMFLPQIPNVGIKSFQLKSLYWETIAYREMMNTIVKSMPSHEISTCFLIFCDYLVYREAFWQLAIQKRKH
ncbi:PREDICTED: uncharacterized protein LOC108760153 [Trachymyrmex cornetzi]|uniref:uncharacterized protein LOC108760153 n=1 Tax=Trachymyrmex cornetzi TaxID=471704 RepID=UPI00084F77CE|nr:PREDICTED: uncharacterized protein LOC108760153 [Trachymyrmex cornetzi]